MNKVMKIKKGVEKTEDGFKPISGYVSKCTTSLIYMLNEDKNVTIKAVGNVAIGNAMKTIARAAKFLEREGKDLEIKVPVFVMENGGDTDIAVFNIDVSVE